MQKSKQPIDHHLQTLLDYMAREGVQNAARGISDMVGEPLTVADPVIINVLLEEIPKLLGGPETEAVGIYLRTTGAMAGQIMIVLPLPKALELVDLIMALEPGTTKILGSLERSALAELGNLTGSFFLNAVDAAMGLDGRPSPPAVIVDMVGAIMNIIIATSAGLSDTVPMIQTTFFRGNREAQADFWVVPDSSALEAMAKKGG